MKPTHAPAELWRPIPGMFGHEASSIGRIRSPHGTIRKPSHLPSGYLTLSVKHRGAQRNYYVHRLVAAAFHGPPPTSSHEVNHKDGDKANNAPANLEWVTKSENRTHAFEVLGVPRGNPVNSGAVAAVTGERNRLAALTDAECATIRARYDAGEAPATIARSTGQKYATIYQIARRINRHRRGTL